MIMFTNGQNEISGFVNDSVYGIFLEEVQILDSNGVLLTETDSSGYYFYSTLSDTLIISFLKEGYETLSKEIAFINTIIDLNISLSLQNQQLDDVPVFDKKTNLFDLTFLDDISSNSIYAGKKNEVIFPVNKTGKSHNNARRMYNKTVSLNIIQTDDVGLQLNIGGRGLNPRRTSNFNVRQNHYDITPDPLGYPESYYTPPFEALDNIELIRGAASLQYGTQFGGLLNFNIKKPNKNKPIELLSINTIGSYNLWTNFTSISGTKGKLGYYAFLNHKRGDGFRLNSDFKSNNLYACFTYSLTNNLDLSSEITYLSYLAHQAGGLTDNMFHDDISQSNRDRNWFEVNWLLYNFKLDYSFSDFTNLSINAYILDASRYAIGFRTNRVDQIDSFLERDLIKSDFNNLSIESKFLHRYLFLEKEMVLLIGAKLFSGENSTQQGPGSDGSGPDFNFYSNIYQNYENQSYYSNPNLNYSIFSEHIIYLNKNMSVTPGIRIEYIKTGSEGYFRDINTDGAGNVIMNNIVSTNDLRERSFLLLGLGYSYKVLSWVEFYLNFSQNYRAVTFADINTINPSFVINPNIKDEDGHTFDFGIRGILGQFLSYDLSTFYLFYNNRIGFIQKEINHLVKNEKGNVGDARIFGQEMLFNFNIDKILSLSKDYKCNYFINLSYLSSEYIRSEVNGIEGKQLEFVPSINLKSGLQLGYKNTITSLQYIFMSKQYTDATNSIDGDLSGIIGEIPEYGVLDFSVSYVFKKYFKLEIGVNNLLDSHYFTTRATGYPGPGIIPSPTRNYYCTFQYKL